jgi:hypothetical protein
MKDTKLYQVSAQKGGIQARASSGGIYVQLSLLKPNPQASKLESHLYSHN